MARAFSPQAIQPLDTPYARGYPGGGASRLIVGFICRSQVAAHRFRMMSERRRRATSLAPAVRPGLTADLNVSAEGAAHAVPGIVKLCEFPGRAGCLPH